MDFKIKKLFIIIMLILFIKQYILNAIEHIIQGSYTIYKSKPVK